MKSRILIIASEGYAWNRACFMINTDYGKAVANAGGLPIVALSPKLVQEYIDMADGLLLTDGPAIHRGRYGEYYKTVEEVPPLSQEREDMEFMLCEMFAKTHKPILGIGRGMKIINAFFGGTLCEDKPGTSGIKKLGDNLTATARSDDGAIEAICHNELAVYGVIQCTDCEDETFKKAFERFVSDCKEGSR